MNRFPVYRWCRTKVTGTEATEVTDMDTGAMEVIAMVAMATTR